MSWPYGAAWSCNTAAGVKNYASGFTVQEVLSFAISYVNTGILDKASADAEAARLLVPPTDAERVYLDGLIATYGSRAVVSNSGTATSRPVYSRNPDGTRNTSAVPNQRVGVAVRCYTFDRIGTTTYYSVKGRPNIVTADMNDKLGDVYAVCTRTDPVGVN